MSRERQFSIETAIELYYSQNELSNKDIMKIFGCSAGYATQMKRRVEERMAKENVRPVVFEAKNVNCEYAFYAWGLDIDELEKKYKKLQRFRKMKGESVA